MSWAAIVVWILMLAAFLSRGSSLLYLMMITGTFGTLQMMPVSGGANLLPQSACAALFVCKVMIQRGNVIRGFESALDPQRLLLFSIFTAYAVFGALILPRVFLGIVEVIPLQAAASGADILRPSSGNFTQSGYIILSYGTALAFSLIGQSAILRVHYLRALIWAAYVLVISGFVDLITYTLHIGSILEPFRTATYAYLVDVESGGAKRVVGLMPEASSFGTACVSLMAALIFFRSFYKEGFERFSVFGAIALLGLMTILSTSSTGIVGISVLGAVYGADFAFRIFDLRNPRRSGLNRELTFVFLTIFAVFVGIVLKPNLLDPVYSMFEGLVFEKTKSASYVERTMWTRIGWQALLDTGGMGAGLGSIRVSNWAVSILGSTGLFGSLLMFGFIVQQTLTTSRAGRKDVAAFAAALKLSLLPTLAMYLVVATTPDIGVGVASVLGLIAASHTPAPHPARTLADGRA